MSTHVYVLKDTDIHLWGLSSRERIGRVLGTGKPDRYREGALPDSGFVMLLRGDYLYDGRILKRLSESENTVLRLLELPGEPLVAARVESELAPAVAAALEASGTLEEGSKLEVVTADELVPPFRAQLRKYEPARVYPISEQDRPELERRLFDGAYKGITDFVTKWIWPVPARLGVRACIALGLTPNHVTALNWVLVVITTLLFSAGHLALGLLVGWFMTYLDTVDGKLARVSVASTKFGHFADHILDIIHPPFWYLAWGMGLASYEPALLQLDMYAAIIVIWVFYILGRFCEGGFDHGIAIFGIFSWRPIDSYSRLVTARRNPCMVLLTAGALLGRPDLGLEAVAILTLLSTLFLFVRLAMGAYQRFRFGPLTSWLAEIDPLEPRPSLAQRWFARREAGRDSERLKPAPGPNR